MPTVTIPKVYMNFKTSLAAKISSSASSGTLSRSTDDDGTTLAGTYLLTHDEGRSTEEHAIVTLAGAAITYVTRGLSRVTGNSNVAANQFEHDLGSSVKITDAPLVILTRLLNGVDTFNAVDWLGVNSISGLATPISSETTKAANVAYVNSVAVAGAPNASSVTKGIVELATAAEAAAGTGTGGTSALLVIPASICNATSSAAALIPVTAGTGKLDIGFMNLAATWTFTSIVDIATATNWKLGGVAFTGSMADLNEAATFFANTAATGANLTTLTAGTTSNADALHTHTFTSLLVGDDSATFTDAAPTTIASATVPAGALGTTKCIRGQFHFSSQVAVGGGGEYAQVAIKYGSTTIATIRIGIGGATRTGICQFEMNANGASAQAGWIRSIGETTGSATAFTAATQTIASGTAAEASAGALTFSVIGNYFQNTTGTTTITGLEIELVK
jgi:hypothetical protein